eukprot:Gb_18778 [translate_table: standard]
MDLNVSSQDYRLHVRIATSLTNEDLLEAKMNPRLRKTLMRFLKKRKSPKRFIKRSSKRRVDVENVGKKEIAAEVKRILQKKHRKERNGPNDSKVALEKKAKVEHKEVSEGVETDNLIVKAEEGNGSKDEEGDIESGEPDQYQDPCRKTVLHNLLKVATILLQIVASMNANIATESLQTPKLWVGIKMHTRRKDNKQNKIRFRQKNTFHGEADKALDMITSDIIFVLQQKEHPKLNK